MANKYDINFYLRQSETSKISKKFADTFGDTPDEIIRAARKRMIHPVECPFNFNGANWPHLTTAADIENELKTNTFAFGKCREFTLLCVAVMRAKGIPARSRCGFANYFCPGFYEDHWVIEYYDGRKWRLADAQKMILKLHTGEFINGAIAWNLIRKFKYDPNLFGFSGNKDLSGRGGYYVIGNMIRDASGLLKTELTYADLNMLMVARHNLSNKGMALLDKMAEMILSEDIESLAQIYSTIWDEYERL